MFTHRQYTRVKSPDIIHMMLYLVVVLSWKKTDCNKTFHFHKLLCFVGARNWPLSVTRQASALLELCPHPMALCYIRTATDVCGHSSVTKNTFSKWLKIWVTLVIPHKILLYWFYHTALCFCHLQLLLYIKYNNQTLEWKQVIHYVTK